MKRERFEIRFQESDVTTHYAEMGDLLSLTFSLAERFLLSVDF